MYDVLPGGVSHEERGIYPRFYMRAIENKVKSKELGRPVFEDIEYVEIIISGDKNNRPHYKVMDSHKNRWPEQYSKFKNGLEQVPDGTILSEWPRMTSSRVQELKASGIFTVEQLSELPDSAIMSLGMGGRELVKEAKDFLSKTNSLEELKKQNEELLERINQLEKMASQPKKRGRKPKLTTLESDNDAADDLPKCS